MAKFRFYLSIGFAGASQEDEVEIPDSDLEGLDEEAREEVIGQWYDDWSQNYLDRGWEEIEGESE